jgi:hypothetical protein
MRSTRIVFVEGLMGAGKSTLVEALVASLNEARVPAMALWEGPTVDEPDQPLRLSPTLPHPYAPWEDFTVEQFAAESIRRWRRFVEIRMTDPFVTASDGLLFHGNMTDLLLMGADPPMLREYVIDVLGALVPLRPAVIYLRRPDVRNALETIAGERGEEWRQYQMGWKLNSPLAIEYGWHDFDGLVSLYTLYRDVCGEILETLTVPKLQIDHHGDWPGLCGAVSDFLGITVPVPGLSSSHTPFAT